MTSFFGYFHKQYMYQKVTSAQKVPLPVLSGEMIQKKAKIDQAKSVENVVPVGKQSNFW